MAEISFYEGTALDPFHSDEEKSVFPNGLKLMPPGIDPYIPGDDLVKAVQMAQILNRPLLLQGEPGCGKTRVAEAVAYELFKKAMGSDEAYKNYYFEWHVKSGSKAQEGLYVINHLKRLHDVNLRISESPDVRLDPKTGKGRYLELGPLGRAFNLTNKMKAALPPPILLIDEIDKADIDFPNDLLLELDRMEFEIPESNDGEGNPIKIKANKDKRPLIIITSNEEKPLPGAFLRRCLYHYIKYPDKDTMESIVKAKFPDFDSVMVADAVRLFGTLRDRIENAATASKNISTSELLDWVKIIAYYHQPSGNGKTETEKVDYTQAIGKDWETLQIFEKFNKEIDDARTKQLAAEPVAALQPV
ncbi:MAG: MoxR family ATPase [Sphingobacteriales bacterium]|nr:MAG: MoxR family ATPase [Sphingobacteriales bacterium]